MVDEVLRPKIVATDEQRSELIPVYTDTFRVTTENDARTHKTLCGGTQIEEIGEDEWNITIEGIVTKQQLDTLRAMRPAGSDLKIIGPLGYVFNQINFDRFTYEVTDELNTGDFNLSDVGGAEALAEFQLQTQDDDAP